MSDDNAPPVETANTSCPTCVEPGRTEKVSTIPHRRGVLSLTIVCDVCRREWTVEQQEEPADQPEVEWTIEYTDPLVTPSR